MKKVILVILSLMVILIFSGCKKQSISSSDADLYDSKKAIEVAQKYLMEIEEENFEEAKKLCTKSFASSSKINSLGSSKIQVFKINKTVEGGAKAAIIFDVIRGDNYSPSNNLGEYSIDIIKEKDEYKVSNLSTTEKYEVYEKENELRFQSSESAESKLILKLLDMPKEVYNKDNNPLERINIPNKNFSSCGISYSGSKIAYSTTDGKDSFVGILYIKQDSVNTLGSNKDKDKKNSDNKTNESDKVQTDKVMNFGLFNDCKIENIIFSSAEDSLLVSYSSENKGVGLRIFNVESGKESTLDIKNKFPRDKYNIKVMYVNEDEVIANVTALDGVSVEDKDLTGIYRININKSTIDKK